MLLSERLRNLPMSFWARLLGKTKIPETFKIADEAGPNVAMYYNPIAIAIITRS
jgi:hypothetical protein